MTQTDSRHALNANVVETERRFCFETVTRVHSSDRRTSVRLTLKSFQSLFLVRQNELRNFSNI